ncbi:sigma-70 family RNA polymerase sigma factor [Bacillus infantis]|uniref:sigma-70 family RNA polymerase sigma factor n=1 Tax=Bacillus infantis TaxID=324767 RepID=UPI001CD5C77C|nr:sigma-70 family RNA polymerase sigma factor [Bacillus infantis]MCA1041959.1 sigma-70 family RNA polymerase sigma factor [Bacillus infantis]
MDIKKVKQAKKGNKKAFQDLLEAEKEKLYKMAYLYMKNEADALEAFQETVYKALISIRNLREEQYFSTWLTRILINTCKDLLKKKNRVIPMEREVLEGKTSPYMPKDGGSELLEMIKGLEEKYKTILILRYYRDYSVRQIAEFLECPEGTVKTNIHRGIGLLREKMKEECVNE